MRDGKRNFECNECINAFIRAQILVIIKDNLLQLVYENVQTEINPCSSSANS
jgi:hypothetical protein